MTGTGAPLRQPGPPAVETVLASAPASWWVTTTSREAFAARRDQELARMAQSREARRIHPQVIDAPFEG